MGAVEVAQGAGKARLEGERERKGKRKGEVGRRIEVALGALEGRWLEGEGKGLGRKRRVGFSLGRGKNPMEAALQDWAEIKGKGEVGQTSQ